MASLSLNSCYVLNNTNFSMSHCLMSVNFVSWVFPECNYAEKNSCGEEGRREGGKEGQNGKE